MSVWLAIPSKKPAGECNAAMQPWRDMGYKIAIFRDKGDEPVDADLLVFGQYAGHPRVTNGLCKMILAMFPQDDWIVSAGDDMRADPNIRADTIAAQCAEHFKGTFGVMQPTGDRWMLDSAGLAASERICGSPFLGRDFIRRAEMGRGPFYEKLYHFYADELLFNVAKMNGILWQRPDLVHMHAHWTREQKARPAYLKAAQDDWDNAKAVFERERANGFRDHGLLAA